jgi:hypothetical protein
MGFMRVRIKQNKTVTRGIMAPFTITHPIHGEALCDEHQFAEFENAGWKKKGARKAKADNKAKEPSDDNEPTDEPPTPAAV